MGAAEQLLEYLNQILSQPEQAVLEVEALPAEFQPLGEKMVQCAGFLRETMALAKEIAKGNLDVPLPSSANEMAAPLKSLQAALKHITWQSQRVAKGDYNQRVDFMGDFAKAFNDMVAQLAQQRDTLLSELESRRRENSDLIQSKKMYEELVGRMEQWVLMADISTGEWLFVSNEPEYLSADPTAREDVRRWVSRRVEENCSKPAGTAEFDLESDGRRRYYAVALYPIYWYQRNTLAFVLTDITREREALLTLQNIAEHDSLTRLYNRRFGMDLLNRWLDEKRSFVLCFVDINNLKGVNDQLGHGEGDRYILLVSTILKKFSADAIVCRIGGDEFMLLVENWTAERAGVRLEQLKASMAGYNDMPRASYDHSISYGLSLVTKDNILPAADLLSMADERMYIYTRAYKRTRRLKQGGEIPHPAMESI